MGMGILWLLRNGFSHLGTLPQASDRSETPGTEQDEAKRGFQTGV